MKPAVDVIFPHASIRRRVLKKVLRGLHLISPVPVTYYNTWVHQKNEHPQLYPYHNTTNDPLISVVVPVFNTPTAFLQELVYSIVSQAYDRWELLLINASTEPQAIRSVKDCQAIDTRIRVINVENTGISGNTNRGVAEAKGTFVAFVDHDDVLDPFALLEIAKVIIEENADVVYTDEDKISENSEVYFDPHYKPDWSPDLFTHVNYVNHLTVVRKSLLEKAGPLNPARDGAQDYDLMLRVFDHDPVVKHISKVLYHWRAARFSTAQNFASKSNITDAGQRALEDHFARKNVKVKVHPKPNRPGFYEIQPQPYKRASVIITPFATDALLRLYVELLLHKTDMRTMHVELIVPQGAEPKEKLPANCTIVTRQADEHYLANAVKAATEEQLTIINGVVLPCTRDWLERLTALLRLGHIHAAAPLITHHGDLVEDCGLVHMTDTGLTPLFRGLPYQNNQTYFGNTDWVRNVDALGGVVTVVRKVSLANFLTRTKIKDVSMLITQYTLSAASSEKTKFNTVFSDVVMDNQSIRLQPISGPSKFFNPNILSTGHGFELYTPESAAINILIGLKEDILYGEVHEAVVKY